LKFKVADKRVTKFLIVSVVVVVSIISTSINSGFALAAPAIKPNAEGTLSVTNIDRANCPSSLLTPENRCPQGSNTGMLTKISFGGRVYDFPVGPCCGEGAAVHAKYNIPIGEKYKITTDVPKKRIVVDKLNISYVFTYEHANIQGGPPHLGGCTGLNACEGTMATNVPLAVVNYHWARQP
jgi:hypothetical protein